MQTIYKKDIIENIFVFSVLLDNAVFEKNNLFNRIKYLKNILNNKL